MGSGYGIYESDKNDTLKDFLDWFHKNANSWGVISIYYPSGHIMRKFDYSLYGNSGRCFYYCLSWELDYKIDKITFDYCFMNKNIQIYLEK